MTNYVSKECTVRWKEDSRITLKINIDFKIDFKITFKHVYSSRGKIRQIVEKMKSLNKTV